ncbi:hypothetical protein XACS582_13070003 [Xanthomonas citri pv. citri]|nr:hypothetical protein XACS582_13070003 [Xanthomonas citri pv. citri]CEH60966.1 hypothetical protein XACLE3_9040003 [Xanthomonas citri pv. citri]
MDFIHCISELADILGQQNYPATPVQSHGYRLHSRSFQTEILDAQQARTVGGACASVARQWAEPGGVVS